MPLKFERRSRVRRLDLTDTGTVKGTCERMPLDGPNEYDVIWDSDPDWIEEDIPETALIHAEKGVPHDAEWRTTHARDVRDIKLGRKKDYNTRKVSDDPVARLRSDRKNVVR